MQALLLALWLATPGSLARSGPPAQAHALVESRASGPQADGAPPTAAPEEEFSPAELRRIRRMSPLPPPPPDATNRFADDPRAAHLGQFLFFDARLSINGEVSCASCHRPEHAFTEQQPLPETIARGSRRTPTLINAAYQRWFFWDGRADSLWSQALGPLENPIEMGFDRLALAHLIARDAELSAAYRALFGDLPRLSDPARFPQHARPTDEPEFEALDSAWRAMLPADRDAINRLFSNCGKAIAAYERLLSSRDSAFDRFVASLDSPDSAHAATAAASVQPPLSASARRGLKLFVGRARCATCHAGPELSDREFHNTSAPPLDGGELRDPGRFAGAALVRASPFNAAGPYSDDPEGAAASRVRHLRVDSESWGEFKTPSLRDVSGRQPYMHQGQFADLDAVLHFYSTLEGAAGRNHHAEQILTPLRLSDAESVDLAAFLASLTGAALPPALLAAPPSPSPPGTDLGQR